MKRPHNSGRLDRGTAPPAPAPDPTRRGHHPRSPAALTAVPLPAGRASRRRRRYRGWRVAAPPPPGRNPRRRKPGQACRCRGPVTADPHARIVHSSGEPVRPPSRKADAPGPPAQQPGGTIHLRTRDAPPYRCGQLQPAPASRTARGISDLCRVIGWWRAEYPDRHRQRSDQHRLAVRSDRRISRDGRGQRSSRSAPGVPERERTERRIRAAGSPDAGVASSAQINHSGALLLNIR
jgi:hypothetical protein